jgi:hypothetical protein
MSSKEIRISAKNIREYKSSTRITNKIVIRTAFTEGKYVGYAEGEVNFH